MRFLALFGGGGWKSLTRVLSLPSFSTPDLTLLLLPRPSSLWDLPVPLPHHLRQRALLPNVSLPSVPRTSARRRFMDPVPRPTGDVSLRVVVGSPRDNDLVAPKNCGRVAIAQESNNCQPEGNQTSPACKHRRANNK